MYITTLNVLYYICKRFLFFNKLATVLNKMNFPTILGILFDPFLEAGYLGVDPLVMDNS